MIKIVCTSCHKPLSLDETKLPMKEVSFPCPACKTKLTVDRRTLDAAPVIPAAAAGHRSAWSSDEPACRHGSRGPAAIKARITTISGPAARSK